MPEAFIIDAVRTPVTRRGGGLAGVHPADLGAHVIKHLLDRTEADPEAVNDVLAYARELAECGLGNVRRLTSGWGSWLAMIGTWGGVRPFRVTARKP